MADFRANHGLFLLLPGAKISLTKLKFSFDGLDGVCILLKMSRSKLARIFNNQHLRSKDTKFRVTKRPRKYIY